MKYKQAFGIFIAFVFFVGIMILSAQKTTAQDLPATNDAVFQTTVETTVVPGSIPNITKTGAGGEEEIFEVADAVTDIAKLKNGDLKVRVYQKPRLIYKSGDIFKVREKGWNLFNENESKLSKLKNGYSYPVNLGSDQAVISAGKLEYNGGKTKKSPVTRNTKQFSDDGASVTELSGIYSNIDIKFRDIGWRREKSFIIRKKPSGIAPDSELVFWEIINLPKDALVYASGDKLESGRQDISGQLLSVEVPEGGKLMISPAFIFDASVVTDNDFDLRAEPLNYRAEVDYEKGILRLGVVVKTDYLLDSERIYPVTIDPNYYACLEEDMGSSNVSCTLTDGYFRQLSGANQTTYYTQDTLFTGYSDTDAATREIFLSFKLPTLPNYTVSSAWLYMKYKNFGTGTYTGDVGLYAKQLMMSVDILGTNYFNIRSALSKMGSEVLINKNNKDVWYEWTVTDIVKTSNQTGGPFVIVVEPTNAWLSGTFPNWPKRLSVFYSQEDTGNNSPYLTVNMTLKQADLTQDSTGATVNKYSFTPGETMNIGVPVKNIGNASPGKSSYVYYYFKKDSYVFSDTYKIGQSIISNLDPGSIYPTGLSYTIPAGTPAGNYYLYFWIDGGQVVTESNESNNSFYFNQMITVSASQPDLLIDSYTLSSYSAKPGETITAYSKVRNVGTGNSGSSYVGYYYSADSACSSGSDQFLNDNYISSLASGAYSSDVSNSITIPSGAAVGTRYICAIADYKSSVSESNESNNISVLSITITDPLEPNDTSGQAYNIGSNTSYTNSNLALTAGDYDWFKFAYNSKTYYFAVRGYSASVVGDYGISFSRSGSTVTMQTTKVDNDVDTYLEWYGTNPIISSVGDDDSGSPSPFSKLTVVITPTDYDFSPSSFYVTDTSVHYSGNSDTVAVSGQIQNTGNVSASGISYQLYLVNGSSEYSLSSLSPSSLSIGAGEIKNVTLSGIIPSGMPYYDVYQIKVILDTDSSFIETSESNNAALTSNTAPVQQWSSGGGGGGGGGGGAAPVDSVPAVASIPIGLKPNGAILVADLLNYRKNFSSQADKKSGNSTADPVNSRNGAFEFEQNDFILTGRGFPIKISRVYNSKAAERNERFGAGWTSSNHMYYFQDPTTKEVQIYLGGSLVSYFTTPDNGATYVAEKGDFNTLYNEGDYLVYKTIDGIKYKFALKLIDNIGMIDSVIDTNNNTTQFAYILKNGVKLLSTITDPSGRSIQFVYPTSETDADWDKIKEVRESLSGVSRLVASYTYDANNNLVQVHRENFYQSEPVVSSDSYYTYDSSGLLLTYTDAKNTVLYNEYDSSGRVTKQYEKNPNLGSDDKRLIYEISYQDSADPTVPESAHCTLTKNYRDADDYYSEKVCFNADELRIYRERGDNIERWSYDASGMPAAYTDGSDNVSNYEYDAKRRVTKETLPDTSWRTVNTFEYENAFNRLIKKTETVSTVAAPTVPVETKTSNFTYDSSGNLIVATDALGNEEKFEYNANGTVKKRVNKLGQAIDYIYDATGNYIVKESTAVAQADGPAQTIAKNYGYDVYGHKISYTDPRNLVYAYAYDYRGNLRQVTDPDGNSKYFTYDSEDHRISETDELGRVTNYTFDADINSSLLKIEKSGVGESIVYEKQYDWVGNLTAEIDPVGGVVSYAYDSSNRISSKTDAVKTANYEYYGDGKLKKETNTGGARSDYFYDARGNNIQVNRYYDGVNYIANKFEYDGFNRRTKAIDGKNYETAYVYDLADRVLQVDDALNNHIKYFYDANGNKIGEITPLAFVDASLKNSFGLSNTYIYDGTNRLIKKINADDKYTLYFYDASGNLIKQIDRQKSDGTQNNHVMNFQYDSLNRQVAVIDAFGGAASSTYDAVGNLVGKKDQMDRVWSYEYDAFNRLTDEFDPAGNNTHYTYDKSWNKLTVTDTESKVTQYQYDSLNRLVKATDPLGNYEEYAYDSLNNKTSVKDGNGYITSYAYDKLSRLTSETNPQEVVINYTYDANNNRLSENISGKITNYEYDELNRLKKRTEPGNKIFTFSYDGNSNKTGEVNANGDAISYTYDKLDRLKKKTLPEGEVNYSYDQWDNLTNVSDLSGTANYTYDLLNRNTNETKAINGLAGGFNVTREYFADSKLKSITDAVVKKVNYSYDSRGLLDKVVYAGADLADYTYTSFGKPLTVAYGNGVVTTYTYDEMQRAKSIETKLGDNILSKQEYTFDKDSNRTQMVEYRLTNGQLTSSTINYSYDSINQLIGADYGHLAANQDLSYTYDDWGNRTNHHTAFGDTSYSYTVDTNEISGLSLNSRLNVAFATDNNGNITKESHSLLGKNTKTVNYDWNSENKLNSIIYQTPNKADNILAFAYDDAGSRVKKSTNGQDVYYINNGLTVLNELDATGSVVKTMISGLGPVAEIDNNDSIKYLIRDALDSVVLVTDGSGVIAHQYSYDPFGNVASEYGEEDGATNYLYTGQEFDAESDLYYYNARYYNPILGRFLSKDPIIHRADGVLGFNEYIYVKNNPLKYTDPSGEEAKKKLIASASSVWDSVVSSDYVQAPAGLVVGASEGAWSTVKSVGNMILNPVDTAVGLWNFGGQVVDGTVNYASNLYNDPSKTLSNTYNGATSWIENSYNDFNSKSTFEKWRTIGFGGEKIGEFVLLTKGAGAAMKVGEGAEAVSAAQVGVKAPSGFKFLQPKFSSTFGVYEDSSFAYQGKKVVDVAQGLKKGEILSSELPIRYVERGGEKLIFNTRSCVACSLAEKEMTFVSETGNSFFEKLVSEKLSKYKNELFDYISQSGGK